MADASILTSIKKMLGIGEDYEAFDTDILIHINSVFSTLNQVGFGPENGFQIEDSSATWDDLLGGDPRKNSIKTFVYLKVRLLFDPPATSFAIDAIQQQTKELEFRIYTAEEVERAQ
jgi:uncharacterized protein Smg (DUF494 family)